MKCPDCGTEMKPLATSVYCPNDCDRKVTEYIVPEKTEPMWPVRPPGGLSITIDPVISCDWYDWATD